jgi:hypothetical protein
MYPCHVSFGQKLVVEMLLVVDLEALIVPYLSLKRGDYKL